MRTSGAALALVLFVVTTSCAVETAPPDRVGDVGDTSGEALKVACNLSRDAILASAQGGRQTAIQRGFSWYDAQVPYSQSKQYGGYRTDCSGFVSMCWELGTSYTTANFIADTSQWSSLGSFGDLNPADAMVYRKGSSGHIMMFLGWNDAAHTEACVLEQASTAEDMQFRARTIDSLVAGGYHAIQNTSYSAAPGGPGQEPGQGQQCYCDADCAQYGDCCSNCPNGTGGSGGSGGSSGSAGSGGSAGGSGGSGGAACYCDADCSYYGDCCSNCGAGAGGSGGSAGGSGGSGGAACYCDADCSYYGDCCSNCGGGSGGSSGSGGSGGSGGACYCDISCLFYGDCCATCP